MLTLRFPKSTLGAIVDVVVEPSAEAADHMTSTGRARPEFFVAKMLVDTGADQTAIDEARISHWGLIYVSAGFVGTMTGTKPARSYELQLQVGAVDAPAPWSVGPITVMALPSSFDGRPYVGLVGRDVLDRAIFTYDGPGHACTIAVPAI